MRALVAAPYVGEIGWELMAWQGRVRWVFQRGRFDRVVVLGGEHQSAFYADMPLTYRTVDLSALPGSAYEDRRIVGETHQLISADVIRSELEPMVTQTVDELQDLGIEVQTLWPAFSGLLWPCDTAHQRFVRFHRPSRQQRRRPWVVFVKRRRSLKSAENWPEAHWAELSDRLWDHGISSSVYPCQAEAAIEVLSNCDLALGSSTGGVHLASLCGCPHVVWSVDDSHLWTSWEMTQRQRYETLWNPFGTPVFYHAAQHHPRPEDVADWIHNALNKIGRQTGSAIPRVSFRWRWRLHRWVAGRILRARSFHRWPWAIQRFVRYKLV